MNTLVARWPATYFMVRSYLRGAKVIAVPFDAASLRWRHRLLQWGPKLFLEVAAELIGGPFAWLRKRKREAHIEACRRQAANSK